VTAYIHHIGTAVPPHAYDQDFICRHMEGWCGDGQSARILRHLARHSGIRTRHSVLPDLVEGEEPVLFRTGADGRLSEPGTQERNRIFIRESGRLGVELARKTVSDSGFTAADITHLVTVSCTGFYAPGLDCEIISELGLSPGTERYHLGFMGCYAAFPALRMARQFCEAQPGAVVLVLCIELCTLHLQVRPAADNLLANTLFADGAGAAIVSARTPAPDRPVLALGPFMSALAREGNGDMAWEIGDSGFNMVLSSYVPDILATNIGRIVDDLLLRTSLSVAEMDLWAVHPGGKSIVDKVEKALGLNPPQVAASRAVLADYGNMSSATILFVLARLLNEAGLESRTVCAMGFGPGLTVETNVSMLLPAGQAADNFDPSTWALEAGR
jgi:predicted naringenin-chalcone synthase